MSHWNNRDCKNCQKRLDWNTRSDAKFCGQNCRKAWSRRKENMRRESRLATSHIAEILKYLRDDELGTEARVLLDELVSMITVRTQP